MGILWDSMGFCLTFDDSTVILTGDFDGDFHVDLMLSSKPWD